MFYQLNGRNTAAANRMNRQEIIRLLERYEQGKCTAAEVAIVESWYNAKISAKRGEKILDDLDKANALIWGLIEQSLINEKVKAPVKLWKRWVGIAAAIIGVVFGIWFYTSNNSRNKFGINSELVSGSHDIAPGKNTATLSLAGGKVIKLDTNRASVIVADSVSTAVMLTATTPMGGTYQFTLADGTKVWLNAASKLEFSSNFEHTKQRTVKLEGEAYFEVAKNKAKPFVVESNGQQVTVLGTHFNINAYPDETGTRTTLLEGSVQVASLAPVGRGAKGGDGRIILKPGEQSLLTSNLTVNKVDVNNVIDWKNGEFAFESEPLGNIMRKVQRWYNVKVVYDEPTLENIRFTGNISRFENVSKLLDILQTTRKVDFKIEQQKIIVTNHLK